MQLLRDENCGIKNIKAMYFHEFIYKSYSALLILLFFFVRDEQKMALALFLISHFIQNIWSTTTLPSLVSIQQAAQSRGSFSFWMFICCFASVLGKELLVAVNSRLRLLMVLPKSWTLLFVPSQFLQTELLGQAELVDLAGNPLL